MEDEKRVAILGRRRLLMSTPSSSGGWLGRGIDDSAREVLADRRWMVSCREIECRRSSKQPRGDEYVRGRRERAVRVAIRPHEKKRQHCVGGTVAV